MRLISRNSWLLNSDLKILNGMSRNTAQQMVINSLVLTACKTKSTNKLIRANFCITRSSLSLHTIEIKRTAGKTRNWMGVKFRNETLFHGVIYLYRGPCRGSGGKVSYFASVCGICSGQSRSGTGVCPRISVYYCLYRSTGAPCSFIHLPSMSYDLSNWTIIVRPRKNPRVLWEWQHSTFILQS
jgi:hypothetical protein